MFDFNGNWVDLVIIVILIYYATETLRYGLWAILIDFFSFLGSFIIALKSYKFAATVLKDNFSLPLSLANAIGFVLSVVLLEVLLGYIAVFLVNKIPTKIRKNKYNKILGVIPAIGEGLILTAFLLNAILTLPVNPLVKTDISESKIAGTILKGTSGIEAVFKNIFGGAIDDTLTHLTIKPGAKETVKLNTKAGNLTEDEPSESGMFNLINGERKKNGIGELAWEPKIVPVSRSYAIDMWQRSYFSHYSPEGEDVGDRLDKAGVKYFVAGENLALAPTLQSAHSGLMNSQGHRENILNPEFRKVGIGVIDNGYYGKIFVQVFTD